MTEDFTFYKSANHMITHLKNNFVLSAKMGSNFFRELFVRKINLWKEGL